MDMPPPLIIPTNIMDQPTYMPSGSAIDSFDAISSDTGMADVPPVPSMTRRWVPKSFTTERQSAVKSFMTKHGLMITNTVFTIIVFGLLVSRVSKTDRALPVGVSLLLTATALVIFQRYNYSACLTGPKWVGYFTTTSLFAAMIMLAVWIKQTKGT